jgi:hypothetical protein
VDSSTRRKQIRVAGGYGAFTVSPSQLRKVEQYIANQIEHQRKKTFEEEFIDLLRLSGVEFDEKYLW